ncbi:MAG: class I SAM-dependent methyltransferase [Acidobacteria bacterium]|nr:class I SAM-dependent methyltransferase [Acidobacteriota bacterium]
MFDPLAGSPWSMDTTVQGFVRSLPNDTLLRFAAAERQRAPGRWALDIGCGAGRNAVPLAREGWQVLGTDLSWPMLEAAAQRARSEETAGRLHLTVAPMDALPVRTRGVDLIIAHGIWNLAASVAEFRRGIAEASRAAAPGAGLFVFTFSRHTLPPELDPVSGEPYAYTEFSGQPQTFLTKAQLVDELGAVGFLLDDAIPFKEHNKPPAGTVHALRTPVLLEAAFRFAGTRPLRRVGT